MAGLHERSAGPPQASSHRSAQHGSGPMSPAPAAGAASRCRPGCGACCIAPSISSPIPGMPQGKPAGVPCVQLDDTLGCRLFGQPSRPAVCRQLQPAPDMCGTSASAALAWLTQLESATRPQA